MGGITLEELVPVLQVSIGPVILISGIGLLLLSMTNRLGRVVDRSRFLRRELRTVPEPDHPRIHFQLTVLAGRATLLKRAITFASISVLFAAILIIVLFVFALLGKENAPSIVFIFAACILSLITSIVYFIIDVHRTLIAFKVDISKN